MRSSLTVLLAASIVLSPGCQRGEAVEADPRQAAVERLLIRYLQADTSNPPGNYDAAVMLLREALTQWGIESELLRCSPDGPPSVYARLPGATSGQDLLLLHHMDVVPADPSRWSTPPFSGEKKQGYIWGRGALDDKSLGVAHLEAIADLRRRRVPLPRGVVFLAVPDEEAGGVRGLGCLLSTHAERFRGVGAVLGEGGSTRTVIDRATAWGVEVQQKVPLWVRVRVSGRGGHGAAAERGGTASSRLVEVLTKLTDELPLRSELTPEAERMFVAQAEAVGGSHRRILGSARESFRSGSLVAVAGASEPVLRDTMAITTLRAGGVVNMAPSEAIAEIDFRLLQTTPVDAMIAQIRRIVKDRAEIEILLRGESAPPSPLDHPLYRLLERMLPAAEEGSIVVPTVIASATDSRYFRARGVPAYGFDPFKTSFYDAAGMHGENERIRVRFFHEGVDLMREIVARYSLGE